MFPTATPIIYKTEIEEKEFPTLTYSFNDSMERLQGKIDYVDAVVQFIKKVLQTDKYAFPIYDQYYGLEWEELLGKDFYYVSAVAKRIIEEGLLPDNRIIKIDNLKVSQGYNIDELIISFDVYHIYGSDPLEFTKTIKPRGAK